MSSEMCECGKHRGGHNNRNWMLHVNTCKKKKILFKQ